MAKSPKSSKKTPVPVPAPTPAPSPILKAKEFSAFQAALKRVANVNLKTATPEQKMAASLDIVSIFQLISAAWPLIVKVLESLKLPIPNQPTPAPSK